MVAAACFDAADGGHREVGQRIGRRRAASFWRSSNMKSLAITILRRSLRISSQRVVVPVRRVHAVTFEARRAER